MKFAVGRAFDRPDLQAVVARSVRQPEQTFRTAYFDSPDLRLWRRRPSHPPLIRGSDSGDRPLLAAEVMPKVLGKRWRKIKRKVAAGGRAPSAGEPHRIRIVAKNLRYASELAQPVVGGPAGKAAKLAENVQTVLGDHHDASSSIDWLSQASSVDSAGVGFAVGVLAARQDRRRQKLVKQWRRRWARRARPAHRRWLA
jgi:CHAD domain